MKRQFLVLVALLMVSIAASAQKKFQVYAVGFYNQENLFDTCTMQARTTMSICLPRDGMA